MQKKKKAPHMTPKKFIHAFSVAAGIILLWRGIWYTTDTLELYFDTPRLISALISIAAGLVILYVPDHDLKEIDKL